VATGALGSGVFAAWPYARRVATQSLFAPEVPTAEYEPIRTPRSLRDAVRLRLTVGFEHSVVISAAQLGDARVLEMLSEQEAWYDAILLESAGGAAPDPDALARFGDRMRTALVPGGRVVLELPASPQVVDALLRAARSGGGCEDVFRCEFTNGSEIYEAIVAAPDAEAWVEYYAPPDGCRRTLTRLF